ncbi:M16 family metallopeptidase [Fibrobacterota bacterium]
MSRIRKTTLPNGIIVATEELPDVYSGSIGIWIDTGSRDERKGNSGVAHFFEHMAFKGTSTRTGREIVNALESGGGQLNAFTTKEQTCFYAKVIEGEVPLALEILLDMVFNPVLEESDLKKEREIIIEELKGYHDNPDEWVYDLFGSALFGGQGMGFPIAGTVQSMRSLKRPRLLSHLKRIRNRLPVYVVASGKLRHRELVRITRSMTRSYNMTQVNGKTRAGIPRTQVARGKVRYFPRHLIKKKDVQQANVIMGGRAYPIGDKRCFPLIILNNILGDGMSSRLFQMLREEYGYVYHVNSFTEGLIQAGVTGISFNTEPKYLEKTLKLINRELTGLKEKGVSQQELAFSKRYHRGTFLLEMESTQSRMAFLARLVMRGGAINSQARYLQALESVTLDDVNKVVRDLFHSRRWALASVMPKKLKADTRKLMDF